MVAMMVHFYAAIIEFILTSSITIWYAAATAKDKGRLQRVIGSAEKVIGCNLPSLQDLHASRTLRHACKIVIDPSHPGHKRFESLPYGRRLRPIRTKTSCYKKLAALTRPGTPTDPQQVQHPMDTIPMDSHPLWTLYCTLY